ncbi:hypothetical protein A5748_28305 [Nocardia sp. 852002-51244_SCH5132740]|nr:hypothetical protein A5748_28305 [Nocardia sp. 852002-51244_SCH5132740]
MDVSDAVLRANAAAVMHPGVVVQSFTLFEFPCLVNGRVPEPPVAFVEGFTGALFLEANTVIRKPHRLTSTR